MRIKDIINFLEDWAPVSLQESYDNSGLIIGDRDTITDQALITLDVTEEVINEAIETKSNFIIAHHPFIFNGIKKIGNSHWIDRCIRKAIKHDISIYAIHTNLDNVHTGVNKRIADKIGLIDTQILKPKNQTLSKLTVFVPSTNSEELLDALYQAGAGKIGNYDHCSFKTNGIGTFRPNDQANPSIGSANVDEAVKENRIEVVVQNHRTSAVLKAMKSSHPYEEVAYYLQELMNSNQEVGAGIIGKLNKALTSKSFLSHLKACMNLNVVRHTALIKDEIETVAICGGSGSFLLDDAKRSKADIFITSDFKYHEFFEANNEIIITDIGHYESEVYTKELLHDVLTKNFTKFAFRLSQVDTNPIKYL